VSERDEWEGNVDQVAEDPSSAWGFWLIAIFLYAVTIYAFSLSWERHRLVEAAPRFAQTLGTVESAGFKERGGTGQVRAQIDVAYEVDGESYRLTTNGVDGKLATAAASGSALADAEVLAARFAPGTPVDVYYDPDSPSLSSLSATVSGGRGLGAAGGSLFLSVAFTFWLWRRRRS
jgi:hypothetical protein